MSQEKTRNDPASLEDLTPEEIPRHHATKDTKHWCKGKEGRQHKPKIVIPANLSNWWKDPCGWYEIAANDLRLHYTCHHVELCSECGKVLRRNYSWLPQTKLLPSEMAAEECPDFTPPPGSRRP